MYILDVDMQNRAQKHACLLCRTFHLKREDPCHMKSYSVILRVRKITYVLVWQNPSKTGTEWNVP